MPFRVKRFLIFCRRDVVFDPVFICTVNLVSMKNTVRASTGYTPFYVNGLTSLPLTLPLRGSGLDKGEVAGRLADISPSTVKKQVSAFLDTRLMSYDMCVTQWLIAKTNRRNK